MQEEKVGYLAVSLGYFKTLFSIAGTQHVVRDSARGARAGRASRTG